MSAQVFRCNLQLRLRTYLPTLICLFLNTGLPLLPIAIAQDSQLSNFQNSQTWGLPEGAIYRLGKGVMGGSDRAIAFSIDGNRLAVASGVGVWIYDVKTARELTLLTKDVASIRSVAYSPDGTILAAGTRRGTIQLWEVSAGENITTLQKSPTGTVAFSSDGTILAAGSRDEITLWDVLTEENIATFPPDDKTWRFSAVFSPDDKALAVGTGSGGIELWDVKTGKKIVTRHAHGGITFSVAFSPDGKTLASGSQDGTALLWKVSELIDD